MTTSDPLKRQAHVWLASSEALPAAGDRAPLLELLSASERARYQRYLSDEARELFLLGHVLVRTSLSHYLEVAPADWRFECNAHGRPEIVGPTAPCALRFNLSHCPGLAACVVTQAIDCGVDVENSTRIERPTEVATSVFADDERASLEGRDAAELRARFFAIWTLKEAYIKARGMGLAIPLKDFSLQPDEPLRLRSRETPPQSAGEWQFALLSVPPPHVAAVALRSGNRRLEIITHTARF
jgi:4'-phosphopantetheinyl transferase